MSEPYKLYGTQFSLYTGKVRSYLLKKNLPFEEILSTVKVYKKFILPRTGVRYIPVLQTPNDKVLQDTTAIIDELEQNHPSPSIYPSTPKQHLVALLLETYGDEWLVLPAMHYRWGYEQVNQPFVYQSFGQVVMPNAPGFIRAWLGKKIGGRFKAMLPSLGITTKTRPAIEQSYMQLLADLEAHFLEYDYLLGNRPSIADFGFIGPFYAHLYRDPYAGKLLRQKAPAVTLWVERMIDKNGITGDFVANDEIPKTLMPVLNRMAKEQLPVLLDTDKKLTQWRKLNSDTEIPRSIGKHPFKIEGVTDERNILPYALWMFKRPIDYYQSLQSQERAQVQEIMTSLGFISVLENGLSNELVRVNNKLEFCEKSSDV